MDTRKAFLTGKVAAVTGAGSGIGKGIAKGMAAFGARLAILERDPETSQRTADEIGAAGGEAVSLCTDVRDGPLGPHPDAPAFGSTPLYGGPYGNRGKGPWTP
jgi:NAD(P)-dependent dehydrogenase (short-subunit alcohol dehydrogenase family)